MSSMARELRAAARTPLPEPIPAVQENVDSATALGEVEFSQLASSTLFMMHEACNTPGLGFESASSGMRRLLFDSSTTVQAFVASCYGPKSIWWVKPRSLVWFDRFLMEVYDDARWKENLRMTRKSFLWICSMLTPSIQKQDTHYRMAVPVPVRVAAALYKLFKGCDYDEVSERFGIGKSTSSLVLKEVCRGINIHFKRCIKWPTGGNLQRMEASFREVSGLPNCHGAIDCTHVEILKPVGPAGGDYFDRKQRHSIILQAVCDTNRRFLDVFIGYPGSVHDARVLRNSGLAEKAQHHQILHEPTMVINGAYILRPYLVGDKGYTPSPWLMSPYIGDASNLSAIQNLFNDRHVRARLVIEQSFGVLKRVFKSLRTTLAVDIHFVPELIYSCCLLHNLLLESRDIDLEAELRGLEEEDEEEEEDDEEPENIVTDVGESIRDNLSQYLVFLR